MCLVMLSRDQQQQKQKAQTEEHMEDDESLDGDDGSGGGEDMDVEFCSSIGVKGHPKYYRCETCNKNSQIIEEEEDEDEEEDCGDDQQRIFECPFCDKVFNRRVS
ncbi:hypothetical protein V6N13_025738 [Hibiscus sabdariffa]